MENTISYSDSSTNVYASITARIKAFFIDLVIQLAASITLSIIINLAMDGFEVSNLRLSGIEFIGSIIFPIFVLLYSVIYEVSSYRGTIGKQFVDIVVVDTDGNTLSIVKAIIRNILKTFISIGAVLALFTQKNQALHDLAAGSLVIKNY